MKKHLTRATLSLIAAAFSLQASAILVGINEAGQGGGFGRMQNLLTIQETGRGKDGVESGCLAGGPDGTQVSGSTCSVFGATVSGQDTKNASNVNLNSLIAFDGRSAGAIRIGFNAAEPASAKQITLNALTLTLYDDSGAPQYSTSGVLCGGLAGCTQNANGSITLITQQGIGNYGFVFALDAEHAAALNSAGPGRIGLASTISGASGSPETFALVAVPEPMTIALMGAGLAALGFLRRFRS